MKTSTKILIITFAVTLVLSLIAIIRVKQHIDANTIKASGTDTSIVYNDLTFDRMVISGNFDVTLSQSEKEQIEIVADKNFVHLLGVIVENGMLSISCPNPFHTFKAHINISYRELGEIHLSAGTQLECKDYLEAPSFKMSSTAGTSSTIHGRFDTLYCTLSAGTMMSLKGSATHAKFDLSAGTRLDAFEFLTDTCTIKAHAGSSVEISVSSFLDAEAGSGSSITYKGQPETVKQNTSSGGAIKSF